MMTRLALSALIAAALCLGGCCSIPADPDDATTRPATIEPAEGEELSTEDTDPMAWEMEDDIEPQASIADPLRPWNWTLFQINDKLHFWVLKPVSRGYGFILPEFMRRGVQNFFENLEDPSHMVSSAMQGNWGDSGASLNRFLINSTVGVGGLMDPATHWLEIKERPRDGDQALAKWRLCKGIYLTWPIIGPSSVRGTFGAVIDIVTDVGTLIPGGGLVDRINDLSLGPDVYKKIVDNSLTPYVAVRDGYVQYRNEKARN